MGDPLKGLNSAAFLPHAPEYFLDAAFEDHADCLCVPRQLAILLGKSLEQIYDSFDEILEEGWQNEGVRPEELQKWCSLHDHPYFLIRAGRMVKIQEPQHKGKKAVAMCAYDSHAYFYKKTTWIESSKTWGF